jgi:hypothetical protein
MASASSIRDQVRQNLFSSELIERPFAAQFNGAVNAGDPTVTVDDGTQFSAGDIIEAQDNGEQLFVVSNAGNVLTVLRGYNGTTDAAHADNVVIFKNPRFTWKQMDDAVDEVLEEFENLGIHVWGTGFVTLVTGQVYYDVTATNVIKIMTCYYPRTSPSLLPVSIPFRELGGDNAILHADVSTSGRGLHLWDWAERVAGDKVYFTYKQRITATTDLLSRQDGIVVAGATYRMFLKTLAPRTQDPGSFGDRQVQPGQGGRDSRYWQVEYLRLVGAEQARLKTEAESLPGSVRQKRIQRWRA